MSVPYNNDTRDSYVERMKGNHLDIAETHYDLGNKVSMWQQLFTWVQTGEIYGDHWDKLKEKL
jgi:hypothetical protein